MNNSILKISDAASIGIHAMLLIANNKGLHTSAKDIAIQLSVSENHLAKILQRLVKAGMITSTRGPKGGFQLTKDSKEITLLEIYEAIDGPLQTSTCILGKKVCISSSCTILGDLITSINTLVKEKFTNTTLSDLQF